MSKLEQLQGQVLKAEADLKATCHRGARPWDLRGGWPSRRAAWERKMSVSSNLGHQLADGFRGKQKRRLKAVHIVHCLLKVSAWVPQVLACDA